MKAFYKELLLERWGKRKTLPNTKRIKPRYPVNAERSYMRMMTELVDYINKPVLRMMTKARWDRWRREHKGVHDSALIVDGHSQDIQEMNLEMLERQAEFLAPDPLNRARKGVLAAVLNVGGAVDDIVEKATNEFLEFTIGRGFDMRTPWTAEAVTEWAGANYERITSMSQAHISKVNVMLREAVAYGESWESVTAKIKKLTGLTKNHAKLIAVDQIGKLNSKLTEYRQTELGISTYYWRTAHDERVRGRPKPGKYPKAVPSHWDMEGVLCRWDDATMCSFDKGATWEKRGPRMPTVHVGIEIRCRCSANPCVDDIIAEGRAILGE
jgi:uncharacterized protein with gpF-like domain